MENNTIEILGQKFTYPTTWQGASSVFVVFACIAFLGATLKSKEIDSWGGLFGRKSEAAYNDSLDTIKKQSKEIKILTDKVEELTVKAELSEEEKNSLSSLLEETRLETEASLINLSESQGQKEAGWNTFKTEVPEQQQQRHQAIIADQTQQIQQQLNSSKNQQEQLQWTQ